MGSRQWSIFLGVEKKVLQIKVRIIITCVNFSKLSFFICLDYKNEIFSPNKFKLCMHGITPNHHKKKMSCYNLVSLLGLIQDDFVRSIVHCLNCVADNQFLFTNDHYIGVECTGMWHHIWENMNWGTNNIPLYLEHVLWRLKLSFSSI